MIPFAIPAAWLLKLKAVPWKLVGAGLAAFALFVLLIRINVWHDAHNALPGVQAALEAEQACADGSQCKAREIKLQEAVGHETVRIVTGYEAELAAIRARPARVVRLCPETRAGGVRGTGPAAAPDGTGPAAGLVSGQAGGDLGPDLYRLARDADEVAARLRALQEWNRALSRP
jgi:hypothetical protein